MGSNQPFVIYGLPRSRTAWLSNLLTYKEWECFHEPAIFMRSIADVKALLTSENIGVADTGIAYGYHLIRHIVPKVREVVIIRPVDEVVQSVLKLDIEGIAKYNVDMLRRNMNYGHRMLKKIAENPDTLVVKYSDLDKEEVIQNIWETCLPYEFDRDRWLELRHKNIQIDFKAFLRYYLANRDKIDKFKRDCKQELWRLAREGSIKSVTKEVRKFYA